MSRYLKQYEKEHMKMAMLKQEETFKKQVQELHRLYRVQKLLLMTDAATAMPASVDRSREPEDERRTRENEAAGSSKTWDAYSDRRKAPPPVLEETDLDLTLAIGSFATAEKTAASSSVDSRTSVSSSSTESGSPGCRVPPPPRPVSATSPNVGQHMVVEQPPWLPQCLSLAR